MGFEITNRAMLSLGAALGAATVLLSYPGGPGAAYRDATAPPEPAAADRLSSAQMMDRIALKEAMIHELIAGRAGLLEIADRFRAMNTDVPGTLELLRTRYPGCAERERSALNVLDYVDGLELPRDRLRFVLRRLAAEYRAAFGTAPSVVAAS